ncbi:MAG: hypothetical protein CL917_00520 [Deltaproteobacteria bacterium]|nr:hypothetical protein [Deltaproteobacteria bacterium]
MFLPLPNSRRLSLSTNADQRGDRLTNTLKINPTPTFVSIFDDKGRGKTSLRTTDPRILKATLRQNSFYEEEAH